MKRFLFFLLLSPVIMAQTEMQSYSVIQKIAGVEIRFYPPVMMAKYTSKTQGSGFEKLFGYISGNNTKNAKIAMTTPVHMEKKTDENSMAFVLPKKFSDGNTPQPNDPSLKVFEDKGDILPPSYFPVTPTHLKKKNIPKYSENFSKKKK